VYNVNCKKMLIYEVALHILALQILLQIEETSDQNLKVILFNEFNLFVSLTTAKQGHLQSCTKTTVQDKII
jgi:hypothetical protein